MTRSFFAALVGAIAIVLSGAPSSAQNAYITNMGDNTVSVIATATNTVVGAPILVGRNPFGVAVTSDGSKVYVTNGLDNTISVIATATNTVIATFPAGHNLVAVAVTPDGAKLYVTECGFGSSSRSVLVIATATNTVITTIPVPTIGAGECPNGLAVSPDGSKVYVAATAGVNVNTGNVGNVLVIATATDTVIATIPILLPFGVAVTPDGSKVYVAQENFDGVSVIATATNTVIATIPMSFNSHPLGVAVTPDGSKVYVTNNTHQNVSVIATATNTVIGTIPVGLEPLGVAVTPDGSKVYVANSGDSNVSVIATATDTVIATVPVGTSPFAWGVFIGPAPFAGAAGYPNCHGKSVSALNRQFEGLPAAATALGYSDVRALQDAINVYCRG
jgi:YVTN family beta-propeller protein